MCVKIPVNSYQHLIHLNICHKRDQHAEPCDGRVQSCWSGTLASGSSMMRPVQTLCVKYTDDACLVIALKNLNIFLLKPIIYLFRIIIPKKISSGYGTAVSYSCASSSQCQETIYINGYPGLTNCCYSNDCNLAKGMHKNHLNVMTLVLAALLLSMIVIR